MWVEHFIGSLLFSWRFSISILIKKQQMVERLCSCTLPKYVKKVAGYNQADSDYTRVHAQLIEENSKRFISCFSSLFACVSKQTFILKQLETPDRFLNKQLSLDDNFLEH